MNQTIATDSAFTAEEQDALRILAGLMVPASAEHKVPGADDEVIFADILRTAATNEAVIRASLAFAQQAAAAADVHLSQATAHLEEALELMPVVAVVMQCYYRDDRVMESIGMEPRPPFPKGFEVEQGDWSMLTPVQQRGKIWRDT